MNDAFKFAKTEKGVPMKTCGNCHYFDSVDKQRVGHCLAEPPLAFPVMVPRENRGLATSLQPMEPAVQSMERPVNFTRRACRHWMIPETTSGW